MKITHKLATSVLALTSVFVGSTMASAGSDAWYVTPEHRGACGEECYAAPAAWIDEVGGQISFGLSCYGPMIMGGPAMEVSEPPFSYVEMMIDGQSLGHFSVDNGLSETYINPLDESRQPASLIYAAIQSGNELNFATPRGDRIDMTLAGSTDALRSMRALCDTTR